MFLSDRTPLDGVPLLISPALPMRPSPGEVGRRIARHVMADVLEWLGEPVGPKPDELTHWVMGFDPAGGNDWVPSWTVFVSAEAYERLLLEGEVVR